MATKFRSINFNGGGTYNGGGSGGGGSTSTISSFYFLPYKCTGAADSPLGVNWTDQAGHSYTGTLAPSSTTVGTEYFVWNPNDVCYDQYITYVTIDDNGNPHYSWVQSGKTGSNPTAMFNLKYIEIGDTDERDINNLIYHQLYEED